MVDEIAARSSFDTGAFKPGLDFARQSLALLPESPLFLVAVSDIQAREHQNDAAISSARKALEYLDRFTRPVAIAEADWPRIKRNQQSIAHFVMGRALIQKAIQQPVGTVRTALLDQAAASLSEARALNPTDEETAYLLGENYLFANNLSRAAAEFAFVYRQRSQFAPQAGEQLRLLYDERRNNASRNPGAAPAANSFEDFVADADRRSTIPSAPVAS